MRYLVAADTGGTFTDVAVYDADEHRLRRGKTLTDYANLVNGVLQGLRAGPRWKSTVWRSVPAHWPMPMRLSDKENGSPSRAKLDERGLR